eukprot:EG_transcript_13111
MPKAALTVAQKFRRKRLRDKARAQQPASPAPAAEEPAAGRQLFAKQVPGHTSEADLRRLFPAVEHVRLFRPGPAGHRTCLLRFPTAAEAAAALDRSVGLQLHGAPLGLVLHRGADEAGPERRARTVHLTGCPADATVAEVRRLFPAARDVVFVHKGGLPTGRAHVVFGSEEEAQAAAKKSAVTLKGLTVAVSRSAAEDRPAPDEATRRRTVFLSGCPAAATEASLRARFPAAEAVTLLQHDGEFSGRCFLVFPTAEEAQAAAKKGTVKVEGAKATIAMAESPEELRQRREAEDRRSVFLRPWLPAFSEADLRAEFPAVQRCQPKLRPGAERGCCFLLFPTEAEAHAAAQRTGLTLQEVSVQLSLVGANKKRKGADLPTGPEPRAKRPK